MEQVDEDTSSHKQRPFGVSNRRSGLEKCHITMQKNCINISKDVNMAYETRIIYLLQVVCFTQYNETFHFPSNFQYIICTCVELTFKELALLINSMRERSTHVQNFFIRVLILFMHSTGFCSCQFLRNVDFDIIKGYLLQWATNFMAWRREKEKG